MTDEPATADNQSELVRRELAQKAREWVSSTSGREEIELIIKQAERAQSELMKARRVDPDTLNVPVNL